MKNNKKECTNQYSETELGLMASCLVFIWDILKWLFLEWKLEENQTIFGLVVAKIGAIGAILFLLWIVFLCFAFLVAMALGQSH